MWRGNFGKWRQRWKNFGGRYVADGMLLELIWAKLIKEIEV